MASISSAADTPRLARVPEWCRHLVTAFLIAAFIFGIHAASGFPQLTDARGDNDSLQRLVQVRDLLGGQGWFDLHQYRLGTGGGLLMHWSRLPDAPIAAIILAVTAFGGGPELAESAARIVWPMLLLVHALFLIMRIARQVGGEWAVLPAAALGAAALYFINLFRPGSLDHHNVQIVLVLAMIALLIDRRPAASALAGLSAALMLAVGMEAIPYVAAGGACVGVAFLFGGADAARHAAWFGIAFAGATLAAFLATVGPGQWAVAYCDTLSVAQLALAAVAGLGLAIAAVTPFVKSSLPRRLAALAVLGAGVAALAVIAFPQCLADPYSAVDPELRRHWIDRVSEVQSVLALAASDWTKLLVYYLTPALALLFHMTRLVRPARSRGDLVYGAFLAVAIAVSLWQLRGSMFAIPLASIGLAVFIGGWRERLASRYSVRSSIAMLLVWLLSFNVLWGFAGHALSRYGDNDAAASAPKINCYPDAGYEQLGALPKGTVLAVTDLGSTILYNTPHHVLAGPYHRNLEGNMLMMRAFTARQDAAEGMVRANGVDYVVLCRGNRETRNYADAAPDGLLADLAADRAPDWLRPVTAGAGEAIEIYRVADR